MCKIKSPSLRNAFTLIEVIVSVIILSVVVLSIYKIASKNSDMALYYSKKPIASFEDSLYLVKDIQKYSKEDKTAYDMLYRTFSINETQTKEILKDTSRGIVLRDSSLLQGTDEGLSASVEQIFLKKTYTSHYFMFDIKSFDQVKLNN